MEINSVNTNINFEHIKKTTDESKKACLSENRTDLASLNNYKRDLVKTSFKGTVENADNSGENPLNKFILNPNFKTSPSHSMYYVMNRATGSVLSKLYLNSGYWRQTALKMETVTPWKMHLYANNEEDWAKMVATVGRYLNTQKVDWKTLGSQSTVDSLNTDEEQKGKAFTVYTSSKEQFKQLAHDIDYIIRLNGLEIEDSSINGDRKLGDTGRIFYRYEHQSGATKDSVYQLHDDKEMQDYQKQYASNRGADKYLADDMAAEDDPFYTFDPKCDL
jgi:hypothetical protein